jgi:hypothetical protein
MKEKRKEVRKGKYKTKKKETNKRKHVLNDG